MIVHLRTKVIPCLAADVDLPDVFADDLPDRYARKYESDLVHSLISLRQA